MCSCACRNAATRCRRRDPRLRDARSRRVGSSGRLPQRHRAEEGTRTHHRRFRGRGTPSASSYQVEVYIEGVDRTNLLLDVTRVFSETGTNVLSCSTNTHRDGMVEMRFLFQVSDLAAIDRLIKSLAELEGVFDAHRMVRGRRCASGSACVARRRRHLPAVGPCRDARCASGGACAPSGAVRS